MIYWAPLLHFYQPPTQLPDVLERICDECYRPLIRLFDGLTGARATVNVTGSLVELLQDRSATDILDGLQHLGRRGQLEFTGTGMYHPILPLIPVSQGRRQIVLNQRMNQGVFGTAYRPAGFFPPELCFAGNIVPTLLETGHRWALLSGVACRSDWPLDFIATVTSDGGELTVFYRDDVLSNRVAFGSLDAEGFIASLIALKGQRKDIYVITAMDAETFGHHLPGWDERFLARVYRMLGGVSGNSGGTSAADQSIVSVTISSLLDVFPRVPTEMPHASSWSTTVDDLGASNPYPLWKDPGNRVHQLQWQLTDLVLDLAQRAEALSDNDVSRRFAQIARVYMDRALHSCQFWWASRRPMWDVNMIHRGLLTQQEALVNAACAIRSSNAPESARSDATYRYVAARDVAARILDELVA